MWFWNRADTDYVLVKTPPKTELEELKDKIKEIEKNHLVDLENYKKVTLNLKNDIVGLTNEINSLRELYTYSPIVFEDCVDYSLPTFVDTGTQKDLLKQVEDIYRVNVGEGHIIIGDKKPDILKCFEKLEDKKPPLVPTRIRKSKRILNKKNLKNKKDNKDKWCH